MCNGGKQVLTAREIAQALFEVRGRSPLDQLLGPKVDVPREGRGLEKQNQKKRDKWEFKT